jgi:hypothetical protein
MKKVSVWHFHLLRPSSSVQLLKSIPIAVQSSRAELKQAVLDAALEEGQQRAR